MVEISCSVVVCSTYSEGNLLLESLAAASLLTVAADSEGPSLAKGRTGLTTRPLAASCLERAERLC